MLKSHEEKRSVLHRVVEMLLNMLRMCTANPSEGEKAMKKSEAFFIGLLKCF